MTQRARADSHIIQMHAMHIARIKSLEGRRNAISMFEDKYDTESTRQLRAEIKRVWPTVRQTGAQQ